MHSISRALLVLCLSFVTFACSDAPDDADGPYLRTSPTPAAPGAPGAAEVEGTGPLIAFLGDSLSAGLHVDADEAFPAVLHRNLVDEGVSFRLLNAGVSGDTTAGGLRRVDWILKQEPDVVIVELGGNDGLRGIQLEATEENLRGIVEKVQASGARAALLGMLLPANYGKDYIDGFASVFARVAEDEELPFVPFFLEGVGGVPELNHPDGIHPTAEGHRIVAENLAPFVQELVEAEAAPSADG